MRRIRAWVRLRAWSAFCATPSLLGRLSTVALVVEVAALVLPGCLVVGCLSSCKTSRFLSATQLLFSLSFAQFLGHHDAVRHHWVSVQVSKAGHAWHGGMSELRILAQHAARLRQGWLCVYRALPEIHVRWKLRAIGTCDQCILW